MKNLMMSIVLWGLSGGVLMADTNPIKHFGMAVDSVRSDIAKAKPDCIKGHENTSQSLNVVYCNLGGYTVKKVTLYLYDEAGNELLRTHIKKDVKLLGSSTFGISAKAYAKNAGNPNYLKARLKYWIAGGESKSCTYTFNPHAFRNVWYVHSRGTTTLNNRCRQDWKQADY